MQNNVLKYLYEIVERKPEKTAYSDGVSALTFEEIYRRCRGIGSFLYKKGIYKKPVAVFMKKSPQEIAAFFGIVAGGDFYVPIDEEMPVGRIQLILNSIQSPLVICDRSTAEKAKSFEAGSGEIVCYEDIAYTDIDDAALDEIYRKAIDTDPVYIVFTSGSTGIPKGVAACHRSVIDYIEQLSEIMGFNEDTVFGNQSPLCFDACLKEIYPTLKFGASTYLIPRSCFSSPIALVRLLNDQKINTICWAASALTMVSAFGTFESVKPEYLHTVAFCGEVFPTRQFRIWRKALPGAVFTNLYGPTETTGVCCYYRVDREFEDNEAIPIGHPFPNCEILLLNQEGRPVEKGEQGEICVRGTSLTLGYYNAPAATGEVFVQNPLNSVYPELIYKTGDIGLVNEAGELCFVSRKDFQIKHMGHRIELGEIEVNVSMLPGIKLSACIYDAQKGKIALYYVGDVIEKEVVLAMKTKLPRYMLPHRTVRLGNMPFTASGKIDRAALKRMQGER